MASPCSRTSAARVSPSTPGADPRRAARRARIPSRPHISIASSSKPHASSATNASADGGASRRSARATSISDCSGSGSSVRRPAVEHPIPGPVDRIRVGQRAHVDPRIRTRDRPARRAASCGAAPGRRTGCPPRPRPVAAPDASTRLPSISTPASLVATTPGARTTNATAIASGESFSTSTTIGAPSPSPTAYTRWTASPPGIRSAVCTTGAGVGRDCRVAPPRARFQPVVPAAHAPFERQGTAVDGPGRVDPGGDAGRQRADTDHSRTGHRMPWSSGFALRNMSSGTRSAARAPS